MGNKKNIFIVDDVQENLQVLGNILKEKGHNISFARDGIQALNGVSKKKPDLILLDISMPNMDGYETCEKLKVNPDTADIPVIFLTAKSEIEDMVKGFKLGAVDYVTKPFNRDELLARVNTHLDLKEAKDIIKKNVEELEKKNQELYISSITDRLTQVYNRLFLMDALSREFSKSKRQKNQLSCIIMDIDFFKTVNDNYGHLVGDLVLKETAKLVNSLIRNEDIFGRYGGEEFLLILPDISLEGAKKVCEKIRKKVESQVLYYETSEIKITMSMGIASIHEHHPDTEEILLALADNALYRAKEQGRNRVVTHRI